MLLCLLIMHLGCALDLEFRLVFLLINKEDAVDFVHTRQKKQAMITASSRASRISKAK